MTLQKFYMETDVATRRIIINTLRRINYKRTADFPPVNICDAPETEDAKQEQWMGMGGNSYVVNYAYIRDDFYPVFPIEGTTTPIINVRRKRRDEPMGDHVHRLAFALIYTDWHWKLRRARESGVLPEAYEMAFHYVGVNYAEFFAMLLRLEDAAATIAPVDVAGILRTCMPPDQRGDPGTVLGLSMDAAVTYLARENALNACGHSFHEMGAEVERVERDYAASLEGDGWKCVKELFVQPIDFQTAIGMGRRIATAFAEAEGYPLPPDEYDGQGEYGGQDGEADDVRRRARLALFSDDQPEIARVATAYANKVMDEGNPKKIIRLLTQMLQLCITTDKIGEAYTLVGMMGKYAAAEGDYVALAQAHRTMLEAEREDAVAAAEQLRLCVDALLLLDDDVRDARRDEVSAIIEALYAHEAQFHKMPQTAPSWEKLAALRDRVRGGRA